MQPELIPRTSPSSVPRRSAASQARRAEFARRDGEILAVSVDDVESHPAWAAELGGVAFPLLSDPAQETARAYEVLNEADGRAFRATFVIDPDGRLAYFVVSPMNVGRSGTRRSASSKRSRRGGSVPPTGGRATRRSTQRSATDVRSRAA